MKKDPPPSPEPKKSKPKPKTSIPKPSIPKKPKEQIETKPPLTKAERDRKMNESYDKQKAAIEAKKENFFVYQLMNPCKMSKAEIMNMITQELERNQGQKKLAELEEAIGRENGEPAIKTNPKALIKKENTFLLAGLIVLCTKGGVKVKWDFKKLREELQLYLERYDHILDKIKVLRTTANNENQQIPPAPFNVLTDELIVLDNAIQVVTFAMEEIWPGTFASGMQTLRKRRGLLKMGVEINSGIHAVSLAEHGDVADNTHSARLIYHPSFRSILGFSLSPNPERELLSNLKLHLEEHISVVKTLRTTGEEGKEVGLISIWQSS